MPELEVWDPRVQHTVGAYRLWCDHDDDCAWARDSNNIRKLKIELAQHIGEKHHQ